MTAGALIEPRRSSALANVGVHRQVRAQFVRDLAERASLLIGIRRPRLVAELAKRHFLAIRQVVENRGQAGTGLGRESRDIHLYSLGRPRPFRGSARIVPEPKPNPKTTLCREGER